MPSLSATMVIAAHLEGYSWLCSSTSRTACSLVFLFYLLVMIYPSLKRKYGSCPGWFSSDSACFGGDDENCGFSPCAWGGRPLTYTVAKYNLVGHFPHHYRPSSWNCGCSRWHKVSVPHAGLAANQCSRGQRLWLDPKARP